MPTPNKLFLICMQTLSYRKTELLKLVEDSVNESRLAYIRAFAVLHSVSTQAQPPSVAITTLSMKITQSLYRIALIKQDAYKIITTVSNQCLMEVFNSMEKRLKRSFEGLLSSAKEMSRVILYLVDPDQNKLDESMLDFTKLDLMVSSLTEQL